MAHRLPDVYRAHRVIEQRTHYLSEAGRNNLVDAFSHVGTLAERAKELSPQQQIEQVVLIEEHLKRVVMEAPERLVRARLAELGERWAEYIREADPYRRDGRLRGVPRHRDLEAQRASIQRMLDDAREKKRAPTWDEWLDGAGLMTEAAVAADDLADKVERCIGEAKKLQRDDAREKTASRRDRVSTARWIVGIILSVLFFATSFILGRQSAPEPSGGPRTTVTTPPATTPGSSTTRGPRTPGANEPSTTTGP